MLYDPKWDKGTLLDQWINWLETKPPEEAYEWRDDPRCGVGQFYGGKGWIGLPGFSKLDAIARGGGCHSNQADWTFGKCLDRAKRYRDLMSLGWFAH